MVRIDFFNAYQSAINAIRATPQTIPVITSIPGIPGIHVWIRRSDPLLSYRDILKRNGKTVKAGSIAIELFVCFKVGESEFIMNMNPLVSNDGSIDISQFRSEYLRIINSGVFPKELKASLGDTRLFHDIFNTYMSATRMIVEATDFECPVQDAPFATA